MKEPLLAWLPQERESEKAVRKSSMSSLDVQKAIAMLNDPAITKTEVAAHFKVSRLTLNKSLERHKKINRTDSTK